MRGPQGFSRVARAVATSQGAARRSRANAALRRLAKGISSSSSITYAPIIARPAMKPRCKLTQASMSGGSSQSQARSP